MTWTHTMRGRALDLLAPKPDDISIDEIARSLAQQCRYAGCISKFYSVAEHCVLISRWLQAQGSSTDIQLGGLLHDAAEAYTGDITYPMQQILWAAAPVARQAYMEVKYRLDKLICASVNLPLECLHSNHVKTADLRILLDERKVLLTEPAPRPWVVDEMGLQALGVKVQCWEPMHAWYEFNDELNRLGI